MSAINSGNQLHREIASLYPAVKRAASAIFDQRFDFSDIGREVARFDPELVQLLSSANTLAQRFRIVNQIGYEVLLPRGQLFSVSAYSEGGEANVEITEAVINQNRLRELTYLNETLIVAEGRFIRRPSGMHAIQTGRYAIIDPKLTYEVASAEFRFGQQFKSDPFEATCDMYILRRKLSPSIDAFCKAMLDAFLNEEVAHAKFAIFTGDNKPYLHSTDQIGYSLPQQARQSLGDSTPLISLLYGTSDPFSNFMMAQAIKEYEGFIAGILSTLRSHRENPEDAVAIATLWIERELHEQYESGASMGNLNLVYKLRADFFSQDVQAHLGIEPSQFFKTLTPVNADAKTHYEKLVNFLDGVYKSHFLTEDERLSRWTKKSLHPHL